MIYQKKCSIQKLRADIYQLFTITIIESRKKELIVEGFLELKIVPIHKLLRMQSDKF